MHWCITDSCAFWCPLGGHSVPFGVHLGFVRVLLRAPVTVCSRPRQPSGMRKKLTAASIIEMTRESTRTPLFWLLHDRHAELSETWQGNRVRWPVVCAWVTSCGITDKQGKALSPGAVKMTWRRVCAAVAEEQAAKPVPALVRSPAVTRPSYAMPQPASAQGDTSVEERMRLMKEKINRRSGRI